MIPGSSAPRDVGRSLLAAPGLAEEATQEMGPWVKGEGPALWLVKEAPSLPPQRAGSFPVIQLGQEQRLPLKLSQIEQEHRKRLCV